MSYPIRGHVKVPAMMRSNAVRKTARGKGFTWNDGRGASDRIRKPGASIICSGVEVLTPNGWDNNRGRYYNVSANHRVKGLGKVKPTKSSRLWILEGVSITSGAGLQQYTNKLISPGR